MERFGLKTWPGHCVIFLGKIIYFHSTSLYPGVKRLPALSGKPDEMLGGGGGRGNLMMDWGPIQGVVVILLSSSYKGEQYNFWLDIPLATWPECGLLIPTYCLLNNVLIHVS